MKFASLLWLRVHDWMSLHERPHLHATSHQMKTTKSLEIQQPCVLRSSERTNTIAPLRDLISFVLNPLQPSYHFEIVKNIDAVLHYSARFVMFILWLTKTKTSRGNTWKERWWINLDAVDSCVFFEADDHCVFFAEQRRHQSVLALYHLQYSSP